jgi:putative addiction module antidote
VTKRKLTRIGNSLGFTLPKEALARFNLREGDTVFVQQTANGIELTPYDPEFEEQMNVADSLLRRYRNAFRALAK